MTKKEALQSTVSEFSVNENLIDKILIDRGVDGDLIYSQSNYTEIEICKAFLYKNIVTNPDFKQGSLAITNKQSSVLLSIANNIFKKNNLNFITGQTKIKLL